MQPITVDGGKGTVELIDEGVLRLVWKPGTVLEAADVQAAMAKVNELADGAEYPMLIDMSNTQAVTRQAKSVFSLKCAASRIALLGSSPVNRVIANFAMARRTLPCPTRFFTSRDEAMHWLLQARLP
ncbi:STAS/SEC14 domain-containing protein [Pseudarthrobacter oxydans]